ncbi:MAG: ABC transporter permease subunit [Candidatus Delongbacteria bacterium]|nr:ABC transporter permease subunit [Candidatus Delongbacteria bacterium]MBN2835593.1 ABC transporter permease subunit [Candidatus Delongbacteria bacterium]
MPIIGKVGNRSFKIKFLNSLIHFVLIAGSITMIYPFLIMVSASFKSNVDSRSFSAVPDFFTNDTILYRKFVESHLNEESNFLIERYKNRYISFDQVNFPKNELKQVRLINEFLDSNIDEYAMYDFAVSQQYGRGVYPKNERNFRNLAKEKSDNNLENFNRIYSSSARNWEEVRMEDRNVLSRSFNRSFSSMQNFYNDFRQTLDRDNKSFYSLDGNFIASELLPSYKGDLNALNKELDTNYNSWGEIILSESLPEGKISKHWINYVKKILNINHIDLNEEGFEQFSIYLRNKYLAIDLLNKTWNTELNSFEDISSNFIKKDGTAAMADFVLFIESYAKPEELKIQSFEIDFREFLREKFSTIDNYNGFIDDRYKQFNDVALAKYPPLTNFSELEDWSLFVKDFVDIKDIALSSASRLDFLKFINNENSEFTKIDYFNSVNGTGYKTWDDFYPSERIPENKNYAHLWSKFISISSPQFLIIDEVNYQDKFTDSVHEKYENIDNLNRKYGKVFTSFNEIPINFEEIDFDNFIRNKKEIFQEFLTRNYTMVLDLMFYNGRAIINTLIYCLLAIFTALIVNPLAAYSMSRFKFKANYKIILILMLTMAFPPMVMGIPNFLMLKNLNLLNTFWALILPAAADGYFIFLLKGFFDSLPKELFESATLDGAGETRIFFQIGMALSKPIMAVIALSAFNGAYRNFMFAFLVCQDDSMWTMMVHIYQLIQRSSSGVGYAALVIASIPTFLVFVFFQNIIIKGIVVPTEK